MTPEREREIERLRQQEAGVSRDGAHATAAPTALPAPMPSGGPLPGGARLSEHGPLDDARFAPGQIFASRHRIVSLLGRGAMGEVYRAEDLKLGQPVALKLIAGRARGADLVQRLITEVRLARTIAHPNVCRVYDIGEADGWWYISMELVDGETLESLLRRIGRLPAEKALDMARQLCAGLAAAHDHGVLHRDLKPSNIMVDGRGRIRILDFGLAVASDERTIGDIAGTPAYMAPEQVVGDRITERTDLYALGLVLYELYAGRKLFPVRSVEERERVGQETPVAPPLPGIDREVERIIHSCLERDPAARPASALAIAALLPGGDPLAAAIAKGVLPSPEMVAAAGPKGALHPVQAWALLGAILIGALGIATQAHVVTVAPSDIPKPPQVLAERARNILASVGADDADVDSASWFDFGGSRASLSPAIPSTESTARGARQTTITFVYRQSPRYLVPQNLFHFVTDVDPPSDIPGMATVTLDPLGRLVRFARVPQQATRGATSGPKIDWAVVFAEAGLDQREFVSAEPDRTPLVPHDARLAWNRASSVFGPLHVTAATLDGNAVQFDVSNSDSQADALRRPLSLGYGSPVAEFALWTLIISVFAAGTVLARYNLRLGQGDRRGARRLATFVVCVGVLAGVLRAHHVPVAVEELSFLLGATGWALAWAGLTWLMYISLEPYVRRLWPRALISWTRLLSGRVRDPLVGRDLLIGMLAGIVRLTILILGIRVGASPAYSVNTAAESLRSIPHFINIALAFELGASLVTALIGVVILLLVRLVVQKTWIAVGGAILVAIPLSGAPFGWVLIFVLAAPLVGLMIFLRVGLLAYSVVFFTDVLVRVPMTLDPAVWYFGHSLVVLLIVGALATYGFLVSLGGRPAFGGTAA